MALHLICALGIVILPAKRAVALFITSTYKLQISCAQPSIVRRSKAEFKWHLNDIFEVRNCSIRTIDYNYSVNGSLSVFARISQNEISLKFVENPITPQLQDPLSHTLHKY